MRRFIIILFLFISAYAIAQQSPQYSQYSFNNFGYNPAFAGTTKCLDFRAGYRMQWVGFEGAPRTSFASIHKKLGRKNFKNKGKHAAGLYIEQDRVHLTARTYIKGAYAYHTKISNKFTMGLGVFAGIQQYSTDNVFGENNPDPVLDAAAGSVIRYPDIMPGILFYSKKAYYSFSINQLYFKSINLGEDEKQINQYIFGAGQKSAYGDWTVFKSFLFKWNVIGPPALDLNLAWIYRQNMSMGLGYRVGESVIAQLKFKIFGSMQIGYAFDFPLNKIYGNYGHEIMIGFSKCGGDGAGSGGGVRQRECAAYY
jgi:type IX secretion system PorP/SprF family membrane protein